jgi:hypothetical protein
MQAMSNADANAELRIMDMIPPVAILLVMPAMLRPAGPRVKLRNTLVKPVEIRWTEEYHQRTRQE